jgi:hypothetical protein
MATPQDEILALKAKIEQQLKSNALSAIQVTNLTNAYNAIAGTNNELEKYRSLLKDSQLIIDDIADGLDFMTKSFLADIAYLTKGKSLLNDQKSAISKLANIAKETLDIKLGEQAIDEKRFKKLQETARKQIDNLKLVRDQYVIEGKNTDEIDTQIEATIELRKGFSKVSEVNEELNKKLGAAPKLVAGIDKAFSKLGLPELGFSQALDETKQLGQAAASQGDEAFKKFSPMKTLTGKIGDNFTSMFSKANILQVGIGLIVDALITADKATGDLAKSFNITYDSAAALRNELIQIGNESGNVALNARALQESMIAVGQSLGSNAKLNTEDLKTFTELREMAEYTNEELVGIQKLTLATGGNLKDNTKQFLGTVAALNAQNKLTVNEKQLLKEVANTSAAIKLSVGGTTEGLAKAAFQAKKFGINLEQADKIAQSLLDFESSISNELEAELLTGKDLNLERARLLALNGDIAGASAEILKQVKGSAEFTKMNRIQQESLAKAVGMGREELAASLIEREALNKLGVKDAAAAKEKFDLLVKEKGYAAAVAEMGDEQYANQLKQQSIQERMNKSVEKMKELFVSIAEPILEILSPLMDLVTAVLPPILGLLQPVLGAFKAIAHTVAGIVKLLTLDFKGAMSSFGSIGSDLIGGVTSSTQFKVGKSIVSSMSDEKSKSQTEFAKGGIITKEVNNATIGEAGPEAVIPLNSPKADRYLGSNNTNTKPISNNINSNVDVKVSAGNTVVQLDGVAIAKAITKYVVDEINKNGVVIA